MAELGSYKSRQVVSTDNDGDLVIKSLQITLETAPASATAAGNAGEVIFTADSIYVCVATDVWVKADLATF